MTPKQNDILTWLIRQASGATTEGVAQCCGLPTKTARVALQELVRSKLATRTKGVWRATQPVTEA